MIGQCLGIGGTVRLTVPGAHHAQGWAHLPGAPDQFSGRRLTGQAGAAQAQGSDFSFSFHIWASGISQKICHKQSKPSSAPPSVQATQGTYFIGSGPDGAVSRRLCRFATGGLRFRNTGIKADVTASGRLRGQALPGKFSANFARGLAVSARFTLLGGSFARSETTSSFSLSVRPLAGFPVTGPPPTR